MISDIKIDLFQALVEKHRQITQADRCDRGLKGFLVEDA